MNIDRRNFLLLSGVVAATTSMALPMAISGKPDLADLSIATGLATDTAFANGANSHIYRTRLTDAASYSQLMEKLAEANNQRLFALLQTGDALMLEQALRDSNKRRYIHRSLQIPDSAAANSWAFDLGRRLSTGREAISSQSHAGAHLVAFAAYL